MRLAVKRFRETPMMQRNKVGSAPTHLNRLFFVILFVFLIIGIIVLPLGIFGIADRRLIEGRDENHGQPSERRYPQHLSRIDLVGIR
jgi:hypothetical protein